MRASFVRDDLRVLKKETDVFVTQEFKWPWYWRVAERVLDAFWNSSPRMASKSTIRCAQSVFWKASLFKKVDQYVQPAYDFSFETSEIMTKRWIRSVLLRAKSDGFTAWFLTAHFVVSGDRESSEPRRRALLKQNLHQLHLVLEHLTKTGYPIMAEIDANIHKDTWAHAELLKILERYSAEIHGEHGVEYAFTINGSKGKFVKVRPTKIGIGELHTDHEVRVLHWTGHSSPH